MKKALLLFGILFLGAGMMHATAQEAKIGGAEISFDKEVHDYGTVEYGGDGNCEFTFTNTGNEPLIISSAKGSCGCTVPSWPKEPIAPGKTATIKVKYNTNKQGPINKTVTVQSNASNKPTMTLRIKGTVKPQPAAPVKTPSGPEAK